jgi:hypothetical protein
MLTVWWRGSTTSPERPPAHPVLLRLLPSNPFANSIPPFVRRPSSLPLFRLPLA